MSIVFFEPNHHEVWHENDAGDLRHAYFDVPLGSRFQATEFVTRIQKEFESTVRKWAAMLQAEGCVPTTRPTLVPGVFYVPEPECEDKRRFYIMARVKRERPELLPLDTVEMLRGVGHVDQAQQSREFFEQMRGFSTANPAADPESIGKTAKEDTKLADKAREEEAWQEEWTYKRTHHITT